MLHTSVRHDIWTRKLTFEDGAVLETTDEHPLYVEGRGFVKAKEVGIGNSIVTRAGPAAKVTAVQGDVRQATVYNFTVEQFHTYFVGDSALWVHNVDCRTYPEPTANGNTLIWEEAGDTRLVIDNPANPGSPITDFDRVVKASNGDIWVVERKGVTDAYNKLSPLTREEQLTNFLDAQITDKLDKIKKAIFGGAPQDLAKAQITDPNRVKIAFDFHGADGKDIDLTVLGRCLERIKQWEGANSGYNVAVKWGG